MLDFIGNYINAGRIFEYLSSYGTDVTLDAARKKPVFYYDNGCEVTFEHSTVETLEMLKLEVPSDSILVAEFFSLVAKLGRCPTISEMQGRSKYSIRQYLERYGQWANFMDRVSRLDLDLNLRPLEWPQRFANFGPSDFADLVDAESSELVTLLGEVKLLIKELESSFLSLGRVKFLQLDVIFYSSC